MKKIISIAVIIILSISVINSQIVSVISPNRKVNVELYNQGDSIEAGWCLKVNYKGANTHIEVIPKIDLGLVCAEENFANGLKLLKVYKPKNIQNKYTMLHGKRAHCRNSANEVTVVFENAIKNNLNLIIRAYNDGVAFRYELPEKGAACKVMDELTTYSIPDSTTRWLEKFNPANEGLYAKMADGSEQKDWAYPALFSTPDTSCWFLIHEADVNRNYCGSKLTNYSDKNSYKITACLL